MNYSQTMDWLFNHCVNILNVAAQHIGMTYNEINIWIFVIIEPLVFVCMCYYILRLRHKIKQHELSRAATPYYVPHLPLSSVEATARRLQQS